MYRAPRFASRLAMLRLWSRTYVEIGSPEGNKSTGYGILCSQILPCIVLVDFMYLYFRSFRSSKRLTFFKKCSKILTAKM